MSKSRDHDGREVIGAESDVAVRGGASALLVPGPMLKRAATVSDNTTTNQEVLA